MQRLLIVGILLVVGAISCTPAAAQSEQQAIRDAIAETDKQVALAESEAAKYTGGLLKVVLDLQVQTLKQTRAMLDQRAKSWTFGIGLRYTVDGKAFVPPADAQAQLAGVDAEIAKLDAQITRQQTEAARYSGGLVQAMALTTLATSQQTMSMLQQRRLALRFGLPQYIGFAGSAATTTAAATPSPSPATPPAPARPQPFEIVSVDSRITESNSTWSRFAWKLTLRNTDTQPHSFDATIEFQDADGFVVDEDDERGMAVPAGAEEVFTGFELIDAAVVSKVNRTNAKVRMNR